MVHFITPEMVKNTMVIPSIAVPTLLLAFTCISVFLTVNYCLHNDIIEPYVGTAINFVTIFAGFTPMHDAAHGSIATNDSGVRWLNTVIGYCIIGKFVPRTLPRLQNVALKTPQVHEQIRG